MCGICGVLSPGGPGGGESEVVAGMMELLEHRGPDGGGLWSHGAATLGHRRLAIIDLEGGYQPLLNETSDVGIAFNGEIYNYRELRRELMGRGHVFRTRSDTEVLVHGYEEWGDEMVHRLRGMFGFAIWDGRRQRLVLGRDRLGIKSIYYHVDRRSGRVVFASEIKALFADPGVPRALNAPRLAEYLTFRAVAGAETLFQDIRELEPGTLLTVEQGRVQTRCYWSPTVEPRRDTSPEQRVEQGRALLVDAVEARLVSDVALGTITSGGLDSSLVSAICAQLSGRSVDTFCVGFADAAYDERPFARQVASQIRSSHHEIEVSPADIERELDRLTWAHDEPLTHPNAVPMHLVFRAAKEDAGVTVLLSGEGADEVFGGYAWYPVAWRRERLRRVAGLRLVAEALPIGKLATLRNVLRPDYLLRANAMAGPATVASLLPTPGDVLQGRREFLPRDEAEGLFAYDQRTYLLPLLQRQDRMSMAAGVEARVPFLDHALIEWANALPMRDKLPAGAAKGLLKSMAAQWLPDSIVHRRKVGFAMPVGQWLRRGGPLAHRVERLTEPGSIVATFASRGSVAEIVGEHDRGAADHTDILWSLLALDTWATTFLGSAVRQERLPGAATGISAAVQPTALPG